MITLTIRQIDDLTYERLRMRAARHGRSLETEVRAILEEVVDAPARNILASLGERIAATGCYADLELPERRRVAHRPVGMS